MTQIGHHDDAYLSTPLEQKLAWFQNAPGLSAVEPASQFMAGAAALYTDSDSQVRATMRSLGADWTGDAATNAGATLQRAADWSQGAGAGHAAGGETVEGYGRSFESVRGQVHWDDPWAWGWSDTMSAAASAATLDPAVFLGNLTTDYFTTAQHNRTNDAAAVAALRAHEQQTRTAVDSFPALTPAAINPSDADGKTSGGSRSVDGLPAAPVAPARAAPITGRSGAGAGVGAGLGAGASGVGRAGGGGAAGDPAGGGPGATAGPSGVGGTAGPIGVGGAATGLVGGPGAASASGAAGRPAPGTPVPGREGGGGPGAGRTGAGGTRAGGPGTGEPGGGRTGAGGPDTGGPGAGGTRPGGPGAGGSGTGGTGAGGTGAGGPGAGGLGGEGSAARTGLPGGFDGVEGRSSGAAGLGVPGVVPPRGSPDGLSSGGSTSRGASGWRDAVSSGPSEPGAISRGPASGAEFASRLPAGSPEAPPSTGARGGTAGAGLPFLGGMGAGAGARSTEHRHAYWVRTSEAFDVPLPPHGDGLLHGSDE